MDEINRQFLNTKIFQQLIKHAVVLIPHDLFFYAIRSYSVDELYWRSHTLTLRTSIHISKSVKRGK